MFKKESVSLESHFQIQKLTLASLTPGAKSKVKSSAQRAIRARAIETYPRLEPYMDDIMPKKEQIDLVKVYVDILERVGPVQIPCPALDYRACLFSFSFNIPAL